MDDYSDDTSDIAYNDPIVDDDDGVVSTSTYYGDDEVDEDVLDDFALPDEDLHGLHIVDEDGNESQVEEKGSKNDTQEE